MPGDTADPGTIKGKYTKEYETIEAVASTAGTLQEVEAFKEHCEKAPLRIKRRKAQSALVPVSAEVISQNLPTDLHFETIELSMVFRKQLDNSDIYIKTGHEIKSSRILFVPKATYKINFFNLNSNVSCIAGCTSLFLKAINFIHF